MILQEHAHFGIYGCFKKNDAILLIKKARGPYKGLYDLPGGSPIEHESNESTLRREIEEETGLGIMSYSKLTEEIITLFYAYTVNSEHYLLRHSALIYLINDYEGNLKLTPDGEDSYGAEWISLLNIHKNNATPFVHYCLTHKQLSTKEYAFDELRVG